MVNAVASAPRCARVSQPTYPEIPVSKMSAPVLRGRAATESEMQLFQKPQFSTASLRELAARRAAIIRGDATPTDLDRQIGMPPYMNSVVADLRRIGLGEIARGSFENDFEQDAWQALADAPSRWTAQVARKLIVTSDFGLSYSLDWCSSLIGDVDAALRVSAAGQRVQGMSMVRFFSAAFSHGLALHSAYYTGEREYDYDAGRMESIMSAGLEFLRIRGADSLAFDSAEAKIETEDEKKADAILEDRVAAALSDVDEDRAEIDDDDEFDLAPPPPDEQRFMLVVPRIDTTGVTSWKRDIAKSWSKWAGKPMPIVQRGDIAAQRRSLIERWPHAADVIDTMLGDLAASTSIRIRPTLLVGKPGAGKSSLARAIADTLGLPVELMSLAGVADSALMGTSAQWSTSRESAPLQLIKRTGTA
ncbi:MAG: AAA family ATPase, partial [Devosia sp.]